MIRLAKAFLGGSILRSTFCGFTWTRRIVRSLIGRVTWIEFVAVTARSTAFPAPLTLYRSFERVPCWYGVVFFGSPRRAAIQVRTMLSMPHSSTAKRHRDTTNNARIDIYARSKRGRWPMHTRMLFNSLLGILPQDTQTGRLVALRNTGK